MSALFLHLSEFTKEKVVLYNNWSKQRKIMRWIFIIEKKDKIKYNILYMYKPIHMEVTA